ncbi:hypothetical protein BJ999_004313 [Actinomadura citrea]|uniref:Major facilitator superfamily (MFS) profile domain-containing protein n=1 Tax=Actinomadura citrea TaxID=46158 RepID=A0A7Y9KCH6_9ACTN|nr:hypothetical protein [Actinomadura citrea]NYE14017.1 hypothetical protein [Actinomadura citrea]
MADLSGRHRMLLAGMALPAAGSLVGGLATTPAMLLTGRVLQGLATAIATPAALSLLRPDRAEAMIRKRSSLSRLQQRSTQPTISSRNSSSASGTPPGPKITSRMRSSVITVLRFFFAWPSDSTASTEDPSHGNGGPFAWRLREHPKGPEQS